MDRRPAVRRNAAPGATVALLLGALALVAAGGILLGKLVAGPLSVVVGNDVDVPVRSFCIGHSSVAATRVLRAVGRMGSAAVTGPIAFVVGMTWWVRTRNPRPALLLAAAFFGAAALTVTVKYAVNRAPASGPLPPFSPGSFPSGHALFAVTVYGTILVLIATASGAGPVRWSLAAPVALLPLGVGVARVYLLDHYLSDVIGSFLMGLAWLVAVVVLIGVSQEGVSAGLPRAQHPER